MSVAQARQALHELFLRYSGEGYPYNETEINKALDDLQQAVMREYYTS